MQKYEAHLSYYCYSLRFDAVVHEEKRRKMQERKRKEPSRECITITPRCWNPSV
uniref:Uncharacterized protein n=1 Tax=Arundo donax TaxID=35708 RepID=A0A0A9GR24_ARUDO